MTNSRGFDDTSPSAYATDPDYLGAAALYVAALGAMVDSCPSLVASMP